MKRERNRRAARAIARDLKRCADDGGFYPIRRPDRECGERVR